MPTEVPYENIPHRWVVITISDGKTSLSRVLMGWWGGYGGGDMWKMNSGITKVEETPDSYIFHGVSGSVYECMKTCYGFTSMMSGVLQGFVEKVAGKGTIVVDDATYKATCEAAQDIARAKTKEKFEKDMSAWEARNAAQKPA